MSWRRWPFASATFSKHKPVLNVASVCKKIGNHKGQGWCQHSGLHRLMRTYASNWAGSSTSEPIVADVSYSYSYQKSPTGYSNNCSGVIASLQRDLGRIGLWELISHISSEVNKQSKDWKYVCHPSQKELGIMVSEPTQWDYSTLHSPQFFCLHFQGWRIQTHCLSQRLQSYLHLSGISSINILEFTFK